MSENEGGFFSRWSQRKQAVKLGLAEEEKAQPKIQETVQSKASSHVSANPDVAENKAEPVKLPTLADVEQLTPQSDFSSFMTQGVSPDVRNAAMKKLFTDPHYNVMDGLDIYIGDYNTPDPLPAGMLAKMVGAQFLGLVKAPEDVAQSAPTETQNTELSQSNDNLQGEATSSAPIENDPAPHDHTHLRLQSDDAPADPETGSGTG